MTTEEVYEMVQAFGDAAARGKKAGFDAVELHASHGYLIAQFLSGHANKRTDEFGGSLHNRMRFLRLVLRDIRKKAGDDFPLIVRISGSEMITGGREVEETKAVCQMCEEEGAAAIHVSISTYGSLAYCIGSTYLAPGYETEAAARVKSSVRIPVITVGRYTDPEIAEAAIRDGSADMVAFGRQSIADPHFPEKVEAGDYDSVIPCISCGQGCIMHLFSDEPISCVVNPFNSTEESYISNKTEREDYLGGAFLPAAYPPSKSPIAKMIGYNIRQCRKYGVNIMTGNELTTEKIKEIHPDVLVIATGSTNLTPPIKGLDSAGVLNPCDVLLGKAVTGHRVLVAGGGLIGAETADFLAEQGREVTVIEMKPEIAADLDPYAKPMLLRELKDHDVTLLTNAAIQEFLTDGVTYSDLTEESGTVRTLKGFDSVVLALGTRNYNPFGQEFQALADEVYVIGDAKKAGKVYAATHEAVDVAMRI